MANQQVPKRTEQTTDRKRTSWEMIIGLVRGYWHLRYPSDVQVGHGEVAREQGLESEGEREGEFDWVRDCQHLERRIWEGSGKGLGRILGRDRAYDCMGGDVTTRPHSGQLTEDKAREEHRDVLHKHHVGYPARSVPAQYHLRSPNLDWIGFGAGTETPRTSSPPASSFHPSRRPFPQPRKGSRRHLGSRSLVLRGAIHRRKIPRRGRR